MANVFRLLPKSLYSHGGGVLPRGMNVLRQGIPEKRDLGNRPCFADPKKMVLFTESLSRWNPSGGGRLVFFGRSLGVEVDISVNREKGHA
jgi:hypothetical protein